MITKELQQSDYRIRKLVGTLGLMLPILLPIVEWEVFASISHYYYKNLPALIFIIILSSFGLFLISYKGYKKDVTTEKLSDDVITNIGGFAALFVVFIPTSCGGSESAAIDALCTAKLYPLLGHNNMILNTIHLICAGVFVLSMGWMSRYKFTRSKDEYESLYKICGNLVFFAVGCIVLFIILEKLGVHFPLKNYYVYVFETIAVIPFGISWLVKGEAIENMKALMDSMKN